MKSKQWISAIVALVVVGATGWFVWNSVNSGAQALPPDAVANRGEPDDSNDSASGDLVKLSDHKIATAGIRTEPVKRGTLQLTRTLPARFAYDDTRHVALRTPTDGVLESVLVKTGDTVQRGQSVAVLRSPSIGMARNQILTSQSDLELAEKAYRWEAGIRDGVSNLAKRIRTGEPIESIKRELQDKTLGDFGGQLLTAYSKSTLASNLSRSIDSVGDSGAISGRVVQQRRSDQQQTEATLDAAIQQSLFQTLQSMAKAEAKVNEAQRGLRIAKQTLNTLLGATVGSTDGLDVSPNDPDVSRLTIKSPLAGTVESKTYSATERVTAQDELFIIADTTSLWVEADIRGRDWNSIKVTTGDTVTVTTPSVDLPPQSATVYVIGRQVDPASGAIPLLAKIDNTDGHFRPGLFARMSVPTQKIENVIVVPDAAVVDLDGKDSVFIESKTGFIPVDVEVGSRSDGQIEIRSGLSEGQRVVVAGAFTLKSELLLEGEE